MPFEPKLILLLFRLHLNIPISLHDHSSERLNLDDAVCYELLVILGRLHGVSLIPSLAAVGPLFLAQWSAIFRATHRSRVEDVHFLALAVRRAFGVHVSRTDASLSVFAIYGRDLESVFLFIRLFLVHVLVDETLQSDARTASRIHDWSSIFVNGRFVRLLLLGLFLLLHGHRLGLLCELPLFRLLSQSFLGSLTRDFEKALRFEPALGDVKLFLDFIEDPLVLMDRRKDVGTELSKVKWRELFELIAVVKPMKRILQRETVGDLEVFPDHNSTSAELAFLDFEFARVHVKNVVDPRQYSREEPDFGPRVESSVGCSIAAIHEGVRLARVAVQITVNENRPLLVGFLDHLLTIEDGGMQGLVRQNPLPVEIDTGKTGPVIASHNAIWIQTRNQFEDEIVPQILRYGVNFDEHFQKARENKARVRFTRVYSRGHYDGLPLFVFLTLGLRSTDGDDWTRKPRDCQTHQLAVVADLIGHLDIGFAVPSTRLIAHLLRVFLRRSLHKLVFPLQQVVNDRGVSVGPRVSNIHGVLVIVESQSEAERKVVGSVSELLHILLWLVLITLFFLFVLVLVE